MLLLYIIIILFFFIKWNKIKYKIEYFNTSDKLFYSPRFELSNSIMLSILNKIKDKSNKYNSIEFKELKKLEYDYYLGFIGQNLESSLINTIIIYFLNKLNIEIVKGKYDEYFFPLFFLLKYFILKHYVKDDLHKIDFVFDIYRIDKYSGFRLFVEIILDNQDIIIYNSNIVDIIKEQDIKINTDKSKPSGKIISSIPEQIDFLNKKLMKEKEILVDNSFMCINGKGSDLYDCQSSIDINNKPKKKGIWDRPCIYNKECPFYKSNKNYDNNFGGCIKGVCEMPIGVSNIGFHFYSDLDKGICHNCHKTSKNCCLEQENKQKYPHLKSPDYAFMNDKRNI